MIICVREYIFEDEDYPEMATWFIDLAKLSTDHPYRIAIEDALEFQKEMGTSATDYEFDGEVSFFDSPSYIMTTDGEDFDEEYPNPLVRNFPITVNGMVRLCVVDENCEVSEDNEELDEDAWCLLQMAPPTPTIN